MQTYTLSDATLAMTEMLDVLKSKNSKTHTDIVREIILESLLERGRCYKVYVVETLKVRIHPTILHNKALAANGYECGDGIKNIRRGAKRVFSDSIRCLKGIFRVNTDGWIDFIGKRPCR